MYCYVVKWPVFRLQRGSAKPPIAPSNFSPLWVDLPCKWAANYNGHKTWMFCAPIWNPITKNIKSLYNLAEAGRKQAK